MARSRAEVRHLAAATLLLLAPLAWGADAPWRAFHSDDVEARVEPAADGARLRYDFRRHAGYVGLEQARVLELPENFALDIELGGNTPVHGLEVKLLDASGDNVWWYRRALLDFPAGRRTLHIRRREIDFAWGPAADRTLRQVARLQIVANADARASDGTLEVGAIHLLPLPPVSPVPPVPEATADGAAVAAPTGRDAQAWHCAAAPCTLTLDYGAAREFGGVTLTWDPARRARGYAVELSLEGERWQPAARIDAGGGRTDRLWLPEAEARYLRLRVEDAPAGAELREVSLEPPAYGTSRNALIAAAARAAPRRDFPRGFTRQSFWTLLGTDGGGHSGLLSEDGALEADRGLPSLEPFVVDDGRVHGWADVAIEQSLAEGYLPEPRVRWRAARWSLEVDAIALPAPDDALLARYTLRNTAPVRRHLTLLLALRPWQVNPPSQFLTTPGGVSPIATLEWDGRTLASGAVRVQPLDRPARVGLYRFEEARVPERLGAGEPGAPAALAQRLEDRSGLGSGVLAFDVDLPAGGERRITVALPFAGAPAARAARALEAAAAAARRAWASRLGRLEVGAPDAPELEDLVRTMRSAEAQLLMSRLGPALRPGTRSYARAWIRDGAMMASALLRLGETRAPEEFLRWFAGFQYSNGKVPCCVDERGADPVPEHDSAGEFVYLAAEVYRRGGDRALVASLWPQVRAAIGYLDGLRATTRGEAVGERPPWFGLLPPSISHEGYSAKPMHSYWDDFWALRGYTDAAWLARALGHDDDAAAIGAARAEFATDLAASVARVAAERHLGYVPGAADLGDFDATSTTIAVAPGTGGLALPAGLLDGTFDRYWHEFSTRREGTRAWIDYTPYEWRVVGTYVRLGERAHALEALRYFMDDRKPRAWNQWPEVVMRDPRTPHFIGDLPHGWVASDFLRSALDLFAYDDDTGAVVLAAGLPSGWLGARGLRVRRLRSAYGPVGYRLARRGGALDFRLDAGSRVPPKGFVLAPPGVPAAGTALVDGHRVRYTDGRIPLGAAPARVRIPLS